MFRAQSCRRRRLVSRKDTSECLLLADTGNGNNRVLGSFDARERQRHATVRVCSDGIIIEANEFTGC
jgi:hypothetical protein